MKCKAVSRSLKSRFIRYTHNIKARPFKHLHKDRVGCGIVEKRHNSKFLSDRENLNFQNSVGKPLKGFRELNKRTLIRKVHR